MKIALVCDWLTNVGGAEKVLLAFHELFPDAPIYTSQYRPKNIDWFVGADVRTGWLNRLPAKLRRFLPFWREFYFARLDLSEYDLVISVTGAEAKFVKADPAFHLSYCHVPTQYYWQLLDQYLENPGFGLLNPLVRIILKLSLKTRRRKDFAAAQKVDQFVTISRYAKAQIKKYYQREAFVVYPPVDVELFNGTEKSLGTGKTLEIEKVGFITTSRQVTWKRLDLCIRACQKLQKPLTIIGEGPEHRRLRNLADKIPGLIHFVPCQPATVLAEYLARADAFLFPSLEPFGIAPVEALAAGCPVIAYSAGGSRDFIIPGKNGLLFERQTIASLIGAMRKFEKCHFNRQTVKKSALKFSKTRFNSEISKLIKTIFEDDNGSYAK